LKNKIKEAQRKIQLDFFHLIAVHPFASPQIFAKANHQCFGGLIRYFPQAAHGRLHPRDLGGALPLTGRNWIVMIVCRRRKFALLEWRTAISNAEWMLTQ
jgi:hypothetical protein